MSTSIGPQEAWPMEETYAGGGHDKCQLPLGHRRLGPQEAWAMEERGVA